MCRGPAVSREVVLSRVRLHFLEWPGSGPPVVLLHPNRTNARTWDFAVAHSHRSDRVLAVDHRGHGLSEWPDGGYALEDYVEDDAEFIRHVAQVPVVLIGAATGGNVALLLASQYPSLVQALVVIDPGLSLDPSISTRVQQEIDAQYVQKSLEHAGEALPFSSLWSDAVRAHFVAHSFRKRAEGGVVPTYRKEAAIETEARLEEDLWNRIDVACPTLAVRGELSTVFTRHNLARLADSIPDCVMCEIPRADHRVAQDNPAGLSAAVDGFLDALDARTAGRDTTTD